MREIKFRAWNKKEKFLDTAWSIDFEHGEVCHRAHNMSDLDDCILMQYTGLKDKNGREIYEGDIVRLCYNGFYNNVEIFKGEVIFEEGSFEVKAKGEYTCLHDGTGLTTSEVIGNIYENKELLEVVE